MPNVNHWAEMRNRWLRKSRRRRRRRRRPIFFNYSWPGENIFPECGRLKIFLNKNPLEGDRWWLVFLTKPLLRQLKLLFRLSALQREWWPVEAVLGGSNTETSVPKFGAPYFHKYLQFKMSNGISVTRLGRIYQTLSKSYQYKILQSLPASRTLKTN